MRSQYIPHGNTASIRCQQLLRSRRLALQSRPWYAASIRTVYTRSMPHPPRGRRCATMAKNGFRVFDSDMHIMEPPDLWERYIAPEFRAIAPRGRTSDNVRDLGLIFPSPAKNVNRVAATPHRGHNFEKNQEIY